MFFFSEDIGKKYQDEAALLTEEQRWDKGNYSIVTEDLDPLPLNVAIF